MRPCLWGREPCPKMQVAVPIKSIPGHRFRLAELHRRALGHRPPAIYGIVVNRSIIDQRAVGHPIDDLITGFIRMGHGTFSRLGVVRIIK